MPACFLEKGRVVQYPFSVLPVFQRNHFKPLGISHAEKGPFSSLGAVQMKSCFNSSKPVLLGCAVALGFKNVEIKRWAIFFSWKRLGKNSQKIGKFSGFICGFLAFWPNDPKGSRNSKYVFPQLFPPKLTEKIWLAPSIPLKAFNDGGDRFLQGTPFFHVWILLYHPPSAYQSSTWRIIPISSWLGSPQNNKPKQGHLEVE